MAAESFIVTLSDGTTDKQFFKISQNGFASRFADYANTQLLRLFIDIDQTVNPSGSLKSDLRTVTLRREEVDTDTGRVSVSKVSFQITIPKGDTITNADIGNDISMLMCLFKTGFIEPFLNGLVQTGDYNVTGPFNPPRS